MNHILNPQARTANWGVEVGVGVQVGAQTGAYAYATANVGKGKYETSSTTYSNTHLTGETINIKSKGDTTLKGADATANTINADVGGKLAIESLQDTAEQHMKQTNAGVRVQVSLGSAWEASGSISQSKANGTYTDVNQQSGLFAKDGGYHVKADTVDLKGGAITSTNAANSELTANAITFSNLENKMEYEADSASMSGGFGGSGGPNISPGMPMSESGSDSSTTRATLTEGKITIGGQSTTAAATGINTDAAAAYNTIDKLPDLQVLLKDQQAMAAAASTVISTVKQASSDIAKEAERQNKTDKTVLGFAKEDLAAAEATKDPAKIAAAQANYDSALKTYNASAEAAKNWGKGGDYSRALDVVTGIIVGGVAGQGGTQIAANAAAPFAAEAIGSYFEDHPNQTAQILSHAVLGAALAYANGGSVAGGAAAGAAGEAAAQYLTKELYPEAYVDGKFDSTLLSEDKKQNIIALSTAVGALVGGAAGGTIYNAAVGGNVAENAATNNHLSAPQSAAFQREFLDACVKGDAQSSKCDGVVKKWVNLSATQAGLTDREIAGWVGLVENDFEPIIDLCNGDSQCLAIANLRKTNVLITAMGDIEGLSAWVVGVKSEILAYQGRYGTLAVAVGLSMMEAVPGGKPISLTVKEIANISNVIQRIYKGSTVIGHALSKHAGRKPEIWGKMTGSMSTWNEQAMKHYNEIMYALGDFKPVVSNGVNFLEKYLPDGRGIRLNLDRTFKGFVD